MPMKKIQTLLLAAAMALPFTAPAKAAPRSYHQLYAYVYYEDSEITATLKAVPGTQITVEVLYPNAEYPRSDNPAELASSLAYVNQFTTNGDGEAEFAVTAREPGVYTLRIFGNIIGIDYAPKKYEPPNELFAVSWAYSGNINDARFQYKVELSQLLLNQLGMQGAAEHLKQRLDLQPEGKRVLFIPAGLIDLMSNNSNGIWWDEKTAECAAYLESFFKAFSEAGGHVDYIFSDAEMGMSIWHLNYVPTMLKNIYNDPRYQTEIRPLLAERGFIFSLPNTQEAKDAYGENCEIWKATSTSNGNAYIWNAVMNERHAKYLDRAVLEPARKYFPNVSYSEYILYNADAWYNLYVDTNHNVPTYQGGTYATAGTHSAPDLYGGWTGQPLITPFGEVIRKGSTYLNADLYYRFFVTFNDINRARGAMLSTEGGRIQPWITTISYIAGIGQARDSEGKYISGDRPYYYEYLFHIGLCNPDPFLYFEAPNIDGVEVGADQHYHNNAAITAALRELNEVAGYSDRKTLVRDLETFANHFILSGMYANGRNIWRITPDIAAFGYTSAEAEQYADEAVAAFKIADDPPTFSVAGRVVTFPGGRIVTPIESSWRSRWGYWIETDAGVEPVVTVTEGYSDFTGFEYNFKIYNSRIGFTTDVIPEEDGIAGVFTYRNSTPDAKSLTLYGVWYDEDGNLVGVVSSDNRKLQPLSDGRIVVKLPPIKEDNVKFFFWDSNTIKPVYPMRILER